MHPITPDFEAFAASAAGHTHVPVVARLICDDLTPVGAFARLEADAERAFLLESVVGGERTARYSFLGADPPATLSVANGIGCYRQHGVGAELRLAAEDPLEVLRGTLTPYRVAPTPGLPRFIGGAVGYAAYDTIRYYEKLPAAPADDRALPDLLFSLYDSLVVFDHVHKSVLIVALAEAQDLSWRSH